MNIKLKKELYSSIMKSVSEEIKKQLNESYPVEGNSPYSLVLSNLDDVKKSFPKNAPSELIKEFNGLFGMVEELHDAYKNNKFLKFKLDYRKFCDSIENYFNKDIFVEWDINHQEGAYIFYSKTKKMTLNDIFDEDELNDLDITIFDDWTLFRIFECFNKNEEIYIDMNGDVYVENKNAKLFKNSHDRIIKTTQDFIKFSSISAKDLYL